MRWWAGDVLGVLVVGTPVLLWSSQWPALRARWVETAAVLTTAALVPLTAFWQLVPASMTMLPLLVWAGIRLGMLGAALVGAVVAVAINQMLTTGHVLFPALGLSPTGAFAITQAYLAFMVLVAILIAQEVDARIRAVSERVIERRERIRIEALAELARQLAADLTPADIGRTVAAAVLQNVGAQALTLGLVDHDGDTLQWVTMAGAPISTAKSAQRLSASMRAQRNSAGTSPRVTGPRLKFQFAGPGTPAQSAVIRTPLSAARLRTAWATSDLQSVISQLTTWQQPRPKSDTMSRPEPSFERPLITPMAFFFTVSLILKLVRIGGWEMEKELKIYHARRGKGSKLGQ